MASNEKIEVNEMDILKYQRFQGAYDDMLDELIERQITAKAALDNGIKISNEDLQNAFEVYRISMGLNKAKDTEELLKSRGLALEDIEEFLETNLLISSFIDDLVEKANMDKYLNNAEVKSLIRNIIYKEWLAGQMR
jgi:hypothetical protein